MKPYKLLLSEHRYAEAAVLLEYEIEDARKNQDEPEMQTLAALGVCYYETQRLEKARPLLEEALEIARSQDDKQGVAAVLNELSLVVSAQGDNDAAIEMCKESAELQLEEGEEPSQQLQTLSVLYQEAGRWDEAMELLATVREGCEARSDLEGLSKCLNEIGLIYRQKGDLARAVKYLVDSIELKHRIGYEDGIELSLQNLNVCVREHPFATLDPEVKQQLERLESILE